MLRLSLAMIVKDEEAALGHCLASVRGLVDEFVVVDTGSTDSTVAIAEAYGARVGHFDWRDDFAAARNESLRLCTGDWVLQLDADEAVDPLDHPVIRQALEQGPAAFALVSRNYVREPSAWLGDQPVVANQAPYGEGAGFPYHADRPALRLFRRDPEVRYGGGGQGRVEPRFADGDLPAASLPAVVHHFGLFEGAKGQGKQDFYLDLAERDVAAHPMEPDRQLNLMVQAHLAGRKERAAKAGLRLRDLIPRTLTLATACQLLGRHQEAAAYLLEVLAVDAQQPLALCRLPMSLAALGRGEEARRYLARAMAAYPTNLGPYVALWRLEEDDGRIPQARYALRRAIEIQPANPELRQALIDCDLRNGMEAQAAADAMEALRAVPRGGEGAWHALVAGILFRAGHARPGKAVLDLGLATFPDHEGLRNLAAGLPAQEGGEP